MYMMLMSLMEVFLFRRTLILMIRLPLLRPLYQLFPILALMLCSKPSDAPDLLILQFYRRVRLAHEALPNQIDAMSDMRWRRHHWHIFLGDLDAFRGGLV